MDSVPNRYTAYHRSAMGRPPIFDTAACQSVTVRLTPAQRLALERAARDNRTNVAGVVREAVNEFVSDYGEPAIFPVRRGRQRRASS